MVYDEHGFGSGLSESFEWMKDWKDDFDSENEIVAKLLFWKRDETHFKDSSVATFCDLVDDSTVEIIHHLTIIITAVIGNIQLIIARII